MYVHIWLVQGEGTKHRTRKAVSRINTKIFGPELRSIILSYNIFKKKREGLRLSRHTNNFSIACIAGIERPLWNSCLTPESLNGRKNNSGKEEDEEEEQVIFGSLPALLRIAIPRYINK